MTSHRLQRVAFELWPGKEGATGRTERANEYIRTATWLMAHGYSCHKCSKYQTQSESVEDLVVALTRFRLLFNGKDIGGFRDVVCFAHEVPM